MEHFTGVDPVTSIAERVKEARGRHGFTAQQLADRLKDVGIQWDRATVTKLETGRRQNVTVVELLALARVLDVAPIHLLVPVDDRTFQVTPTEEQPAQRARDWIRGWIPLPGTDRRIFRSETPLAEMGEGKLRPPSAEELSIARRAIGLNEDGTLPGQTETDS
jgi:transcriptional regulator with XRE-family HTH domain